MKPLSPPPPLPHPSLSALRSSDFFILKYLQPLQTVSGFSITVLLDAAFLKA